MQKKTHLNSQDALLDAYVSTCIGAEESIAS